MNTRRTFLTSLAGIPLLSFADLGCGASATTVLSDIEAAMTDAEIAIQTIGAGVAAYFNLHPNATLQQQITTAETDASTALRAVSAALAGATSLAADNVQTALQSFATAYNALMSLVAAIGIQTGPASSPAVRVGGTLFVPPPRILQAIKPAVSAKDKLTLPPKG